MYYLVKYKLALFLSLFSFILGCSLTLSFLKTDDCKRIITFNDRHDHNVRKPVPYQSMKHTLIILIISNPDNLDLRKTIRETWLALCKEDSEVKHYFVVGSSNLTDKQHLQLKNEQYINDDLMMLPNVVDSYSSLTKKVLEAFLWLDDWNDDSFKYVLKCDDDSFVRVKELISELKIKRDSSLYWGFFNGKAQVKRSGKWKEVGWILCDYYLPYALGGGYILSQKLVHYIAKNAKYLKLYRSEDVSVGVWLANVADVTRHHDPRFDTEFRSRGCSNSYIVTHKRSQAEMKQMFESLKATGKLCRYEYRTRLSYLYDWNVPPSKCCLRNSTNIP